MTALAFVDVETTGLDPARHDIWELAIITDEGKEWEFHLPVDLARADPTGLRVGRFYERRNALGPPWCHAVATASRWRVDHAEKKAAGKDEKWLTDQPRSMAETVARLLDGAHMVGAVPSFDAAFLTRWLNAQGQAATWHYHLVDVEALAAGWLATGARVSPDEAQGADMSIVHPPWNSNDLSRAVGVEPADYDRHTALGDARWAKAIYEAVMG